MKLSPVGGIIMKNLWNKLLCLFGHHSYYKIKELSDYSVKVGCACCSKQWGMNHPTKSFVEWDEDLADIYATKITWGIDND
tara:strand:+ start:781 stop:1023 length:243 start_codon:yes stop_codon:yes gene_type:complete